MTPTMAVRPAAATAHERAVGRVKAFAARHLPAIEQAVAESVSGCGPGLEWIEKATRDAVGVGGTGGRRWRPLLTLASAEACGVAAQVALEVAVAMELTHTASLVLDDLPCMDDSALRRGRLATHRTVGPAGAILVAVGLLGRAAELLGAAPRDGAALAREWGETIGLAGMAGGQAVDVRQSGAARAAARRLYRRKTTSLAAFALGAGARVAGADDQTRAALEGYGRDLGWAYQLADDADDLAEDGAAGRAPGGRAPARQSQFLMRRAERRLAACPELGADGASLIVAFGRVVVPGGDATPPWQGR